MTTTVKRLQMRFRDNNGRIVGLSVNPPKEPVNMADVQEVMDLVLGTNMFYTFTGGDIVEKLDVRLYTAEYETLEEF